MTRFMKLYISIIQGPGDDYSTHNHMSVMFVRIATIINYNTACVLSGIGMLKNANLKTTLTIQEGGGCLKFGATCVK